MQLFDDPRELATPRRVLLCRPDPFLVYYFLSFLHFLFSSPSHHFPDQVPDEHFALDFASQAARNMFHGRRVMQFHLTWFGTLYECDVKPEA